MWRTESAEDMGVSPASSRRTAALLACAALAGPVAAAFAQSPIMPGGRYRGPLPAGGSIRFLVADNARSIRRGLEMTGVRAPCGGGVYVTLFNLTIDRPIPIRGVSFAITRKSADTTTKVSGRFSSGGVARGTVSVKFGNGCRVSGVRFTARA